MDNTNKENIQPNIEGKKAAIASKSWGRTTVK